MTTSSDRGGGVKAGEPIPTRESVPLWSETQKQGFRRLSRLRDHHAPRVRCPLPPGMGVRGPPPLSCPLPCPEARLVAFILYLDSGPRPVEPLPVSTPDSETVEDAVPA